MVQQRPALSPEQEKLFAEFQHRVDARYQADILARYVMPLPALPDEGY